MSPGGYGNLIGQPAGEEERERGEICATWKLEANPNPKGWIRLDLKGAARRVSSSMAKMISSLANYEAIGKLQCTSGFSVGFRVFSQYEEFQTKVKLNKTQKPTNRLIQQAASFSFTPKVG